MRSELGARIRELKIFLFDLDGVLRSDNASFENCYSRVSRAAREFKNLGTLFGIVTAGKEDEHLSRLRSIENCIVFSSSIDKVSLTRQFLEEKNIDYKNVFYIGDDLLDIPLLRQCGVSCAPRNAKREVKRSVSFIAKAESCDDLLDEIINLFKRSKEAANRAT